MIKLNMEVAEYTEGSLSGNLFFLGNGIFITVNDYNYEINVFISKYRLNSNNEWTFERDIIRFPSSLWYEFTQKITSDEPFFIPNFLIVYKKLNMYFIQKLHSRNDNFHIISKERCFLNEMQWSALKNLQMDIYDRIIYMSFGNLFTRILTTKSKNVQTGFLEEVCSLVWDKMKSTLDVEGNRVDTWNRHFYKSAFNINIETLAKLFWKKYNVVVDTRKDVNAIFQNIYKMYLSLDK